MSDKQLLQEKYTEYLSNAFNLSLKDADDFTFTLFETIETYLAMGHHISTIKIFSNISECKDHRVLVTKTGKYKGLIGGLIRVVECTGLEDNQSFIKKTLPISEIKLPPL